MAVHLAKALREAMAAAVAPMAPLPTFEAAGADSGPIDLGTTDISGLIRGADYVWKPCVAVRCGPMTVPDPLPLGEFVEVGYVDRYDEILHDLGIDI
jgi:hypothetical protein